jgi:predicted outer membrane repeat protein
MNKLTQVILLVSALLWLPADGLMTSATAQTTPVPTDATTNPATIRLQKRMEALQMRNERFAASRPTARDADPVASPLDDLQGKWEPRAPLPTGPRERALNFTIGDKFYVAVGRSLPGWAVRGLNATDVWAYDFATDAWEEISPFPGPGMRNCASFVIDGIAYAVTGHSSTTYIDVFWKYDPTTDTWEELPPFPGGRRSWPAAFALDGKGYVVAGGIGPDDPGGAEYHNDVWEFDPATGSWTQLADFPGQPRWRSFSFVIDGHAYVGGGSQDGALGSDYTDCYRFNPADGSWTPIADFPEGWGVAGYAAAIDGKGYVGEGVNDEYFGNVSTRLWEYDPGADAWTHVSNTPGYQIGRMYAFSSVHDGKLYVGGGRVNTWAAVLSPMYGDFYVWDKGLDPAPEDYDQWESLGRGDAVDEELVGVYGIRAISEDTLWALPAPNLTFSSTPLQLMYSADGGATWETFTVDDQRAYYSAHFHALDSRRAWVMGTLLGGFTNVFRTQDGGQTWEKILDSADNLMPESNGIHFFDDEVGLCWGNDFYDDPRAYFYRTEDGGATWQQLDDPALPGAFSFEWAFSNTGNNNYAAMGDTIWIPVDFIMVRSTDRGATWARVDFDMSIYSVAFEDALRGMTISDNWPGVTAARAFVTEDGGATWTEVSQPSPAVISVNHIPGSPGAYVAYSTIQCDPHLAYTPNYGQDWVNIYAPPALHAIQFLSPELAYAGGPLRRDVPEGVYRWKGDLSVFNRLYVKADATGANTGRTWHDAFTDLQDALAIAQPGEEIWVAQGLYTPAAPGGDRNATFRVDKDLHLYGGFAGTEARLEERGDPAGHPAILSGDLNGDDVTGDFEANRSDNVYTVVSVALGITGATLIDGFTIRGGHADGPGDLEDKRGAGIFMSGTATISNCVFDQNFAVLSGGGIAMPNASQGVVIENCIFSHNRANAGSGLIASAPRQLLVENCTFSGNSAVEGTFESHGGGLYLTNPDESVIRNCHFTDNTAARTGGGMFAWTTAASIEASLAIENCAFEGNGALRGAGASFVPWGDNSVFSISDCRFDGNEAAGSGGGIYVGVNMNAENHHFSLSHSEFTANRCGDVGSAVDMVTRAENTTFETRHCTFIGNLNDEVSGAYLPFGATPMPLVRRSWTVAISKTTSLATAAQWK